MGGWIAFVEDATCEGDEDGDGFFGVCDRCPSVDDSVFGPECNGAIPTSSEWGLIVLGLLLLATGKVFFGRLSRRCSAH